VDPLRNICEELLPGLKRMVFFSSTTAAFGNAGQCDYASGNTVFDQFVSVLGQRHSDIRALSIGWGVWKGAGMVSATLEAEMNKRGLHLIPLSGGTEFFCNELWYGHDPQVVAMGGDPDVVAAYLSQSMSRSEAQAS